MPITHQPGTNLAFQQQFRPIGRIRTGQQVEFTRNNGSKGKRPSRLETFRLTSADGRMLERAAAVYGGVVEKWPEAPDGDALQLVTDARELDVLVPGGQPLSQWYEMWGAGGCLRRCTGEEETLSGGTCMCPADPADRTELAAKGNACKPTTRVSLLLPQMDLGSWLLVSHSYYAAVELPPVVSLLAEMASRTSQPVAAKIWIDQRRIKRPNQPPKEFSVPAIRTGVSWANLLGDGGPIEQRVLASGRVEATLPAGETELPDDPPVSDGPSGPEPAAPLSTSAPDENVAAAPGDETEAAFREEPAGLTRDELVVELRALEITTGAAAVRSKQMWPDRGDVPLTDAQRMELLTALRTDQAAAAAL